MTYEKFLEGFLSKGLLRRQESDLRAVKSEATDALNSATSFVDLIKGIVQKENPQLEFNL
jgi:hypothetical protein